MPNIRFPLPPIPLCDFPNSVPEKLLCRFIFVCMYINIFIRHIIRFLQIFPKQTSLAYER